MSSKKLPKCRTLADLKRAFAEITTLRRYWTVCIDSGGHYLRYIGPNPEGMEPEQPIILDLPCSPCELLAEALTLAGIPAEQA